MAILLNRKNKGSFAAAFIFIWMAGFQKCRTHLANLQKSVPNARKNLHFCMFRGADGRIRTADLILTNKRTYVRVSSCRFYLGFYLKAPEPRCFKIKFGAT
jgi:hypothetical protein